MGGTSSNRQTGRRKRSERGRRTACDEAPLTPSSKIEVTRQKGGRSDGVVCVPKSAPLEETQDVRDLEIGEIGVMDIDESERTSLYRIGRQCIAQAQ